MRVLGLVPARGGSKGIPRKNIRPLGGRPLLQYTLEAAREARSLARIVVSTEDDEVAAIARTCGADVPFVRPQELAADDTPTLPVVQHALSTLEGLGERYDAVCLLQPTHPLRRAEHIDRCVELLVERQADAVVTIRRVPAEHNPHWVYFANGDGCLRLATGERDPIPRRQELPTAFHREGSVYVTRRDVLMEGNSLYGSRLVGLEMDPSESLNIDDWSDWQRAEELLGGRG